MVEWIDPVAKLLGQVLPALGSWWTSRKPSPASADVITEEVEVETETVTRRVRKVTRRKGNKVKPKEPGALH